MISSGSAGMTRNTLVTSDSTSSHAPPRKAAATPTMTASTVAMTPTHERQLQGQPDPDEQLGEHVLAALGGAEQVRGVRRGAATGPVRVLERGVVGRNDRPDDGGEHEEARAGRRPPWPWLAAAASSPACRGVSGTAGGSALTGRAMVIRPPSRARARGSTTTMTRSTIRLASRTAKVITRKIACISG